MTVFGISLWMKVGHEGDRMQCFKCGRKWNSSPKPLSVCSTGATHTQGPLHVCVKCLTPTKTPPKPILHIPNAKSTLPGKGRFFISRSLFSVFLADSQSKDTKVSDVCGLFEKTLPAKELSHLHCVLQGIIVRKYWQY